MGRHFEDPAPHATAYFLFSEASKGKVFPYDWAHEWKWSRKGLWIDKAIAGLSPIGAIMNLASLLNPKKLPRKGSQDWHLIRHAIAQVEAQSIIGHASK